MLTYPEATDRSYEVPRREPYNEYRAKLSFNLITKKITNTPLTYPLVKAAAVSTPVEADYICIPNLEFNMTSHSISTFKCG